MTSTARRLRVLLTATARQRLEQLGLPLRPCAADHRPGQIERVGKQSGWADTAVDRLVVLLADPREEAVIEFQIYRISY